MRVEEISENATRCVPCVRVAWDYRGEASTECCLYKVVWNITVQTYINKTVVVFQHGGKMLPVSHCKSPAWSGTSGNVTRVDMDKGGELKTAWNSNFDCTVPLNVCTNKWHSPLKWKRVILSWLPTPCRASLEEILSAVYHNVFSLPMHQQERRVFPLTTALREIGTGEWAFPRGDCFSGVATMWRWKTISKALNRCCNYLMHAGIPWVRCTLSDIA